MHLLHTQSCKRALTTLLMVTVLFAQWAGLRHRIEHWRGEPAQLLAAVTSSLAGSSTQSAPTVSAALAGKRNDQVGVEDKHHHSCIEYDAATLADAVCCPFLLTPALSNHDAAISAVAYLSATRRLLLHFFSHAPPAC